MNPPQEKQERTLADVALRDKYQADDGRVYLTGSQALVRIALTQARRDRAAGKKTAGYITGYRGSPLHTFDLELSRVPELLESHDIKFEPGINEDLAATAVRGSQMAGVYGDGTYDGVFAMWYGKSPGLDRSIDAIRHGNLCGTSPMGGALAVIGDDHGMRSTDTLAHCEMTCEDLMMPLLYPANLQEVLDFGHLGIALSRFCGAWVGLKILPETAECSGTVDAGLDRTEIVTPDFVMPEGGVHSRAMDIWMVTRWDERLVRHKIPAAIAFAVANKLNYVSHGAANARFGIIAAGKAWLDVLEALNTLGFTEAALAEAGITVFKVGMVWPHDEQGFRDFARGLEEVLIVEEKREQIETAVRNACYDLSENERPRVVGRRSESGDILIDQLLDLTPEKVASAIATRLVALDPRFEFDEFFERQRVKTQMLGELDALQLARPPYFCSGCPHNISTKTPEGSRVYAGIGCHGMAMLSGRAVDEMHMGGEGTNWIGESHFVSTKHVFQNMGDGTFSHSGSLAIRAAKASEANVTFKILFNDAVAMTGGQTNEIDLTPQMISHQVFAEGVQKIVVVSDEPGKYTNQSNAFAEGVTVHHRNEMPKIEAMLKTVSGVSVLIYDQVCAAEKRRRRKRGLMPDPDQRIFINHRVCEGCGDCGVQSNCLSVVPRKTVFGTKRKIEQSSCNKDFSCVQGFCPSFVSVRGGKLRKRAGAESQVPTVAAKPELPSIPTDDNYRILIAGVGGTGVVTVGALIGMAARLEGKSASVLDQMGLAQKGGAVVSHIRIAPTDASIRAVRLNQSSADLILGCDALVASGDMVMAIAANGRTKAVVNTHETITGAFVANGDLEFPSSTITSRLTAMLGKENCEFIDASAIATRLLGDALAGNLFLLGLAWQKGLVPVSAEALHRAIELNGVAVDWNKSAFEWGRLAHADRSSVLGAAQTEAETPELTTTDQRLDFYEQELTRYQNEDYARQFRASIQRVHRAEKALGSSTEMLTACAMKNLHKLMAYKDEYEVARLFSDASFRKELDEQFEGDYRLSLHLAPPSLTSLLNRKPFATPEKKEFGPWVLRLMPLLQRLKFLRGTRFDLFGYSVERRIERELAVEYEALMDEVVGNLSSRNVELAAQLLDLPSLVRGYGHVKLASVTRYREEKQKLLSRWRGDSGPDVIAVNAAA